MKKEEKIEVVENIVKTIEGSNFYFNKDKFKNIFINLEEIIGENTDNKNVYYKLNDVMNNVEYITASFYMINNKKENVLYLLNKIKEV